MEAFYIHHIVAPLFAVVNLDQATAQTVLLFVPDECKDKLNFGVR